MDKESAHLQNFYYQICRLTLFLNSMIHQKCENIQIFIENIWIQTLCEPVMRKDVFDAYANRKDLDQLA